MPIHNILKAQIIHIVVWYKGTLY